MNQPGNDSGIFVSKNNSDGAAKKSSKPSSPRSNNSASPKHTAGVLTEDEQIAQDQENTQAAIQAENGIDVDNSIQDDQSDAGYVSDNMSAASTSITSSVRDYPFENGRRYHKFREGSYNFPNDDSEQEREDVKHAMIVNMCQVLHFAPLSAPHRILDMATGTGVWAIESKFSRNLILFMI